MSRGIPSSASTSHFSALAFLAFPKTVDYALILINSFKPQPVLAYRLILIYISINLTLLIVPILETATFLA